MAKFHFRNDQDKNVELVVEPWAMSEMVPAGEVVEFEVNDLPSPDIEFCITEKGQAYIYVMSERVRICIDGEDHEFTPSSRPGSAQEFWVLRKHLWS